MRLRTSPSILNVLRTFIMNGYWILPSFSASVEMTVRPLPLQSVHMVTWGHAVLVFYTLLHLICWCLMGDFCTEDMDTFPMASKTSSPIASWPSLVYSTFFSQYFWYLYLWCSPCVMTLEVFCFVFFWKKSCSICIIWENLPVKTSETGIFFVGSL